MTCAIHGDAWCTCGDADGSAPRGFASREEAEAFAARQRKSRPVDERRANWLPAPEYFLLNQACVVINSAFGWGSTFLVGSALHTRDHRDVDIRTILDDAVFERLFPGAAKNGSYQLNALWSLVCSSVSLWLSRQSGLKVDYQIQQRTAANELYSGKTGHHRHPIGIFLEP